MIVGGLLLVAGSVLLYRYRHAKGTGVRVGMLLLAIQCTTVLLSPVTHAMTAAECRAQNAQQTASTAVGLPDFSTGGVGTLQRMSVVSNDTPSDGAIFVLASLRLGLVENPLPNSTVSSDRQTVVVPTEGTYEAGLDGTVSFMPEAGFVGQARGVAYMIDDSKGRTVTAQYRPTVTGAGGVVCVDPASETVSLENVAEPAILEVNGNLQEDDNGVIYGPFMSIQIVNQLLANGSQLDFDSGDIDIDPSVSGIQTTIDHSATEGWSAIYNPAIDEYQATITDYNLFTTTHTPAQEYFDVTTGGWWKLYHVAQYTLGAKPNCSQPQPAYIPLRVQYTALN